MIIGSIVWVAQRFRFLVRSRFLYCSIFVVLIYKKVSILNHILREKKTPLSEYNYYYKYILVDMVLPRSFITVMINVGISFFSIIILWTLSPWLVLPVFAFVVIAIILSIYIR